MGKAKEKKNVNDSSSVPVSDNGVCCGTCEELSSYMSSVWCKICEVKFHPACVNISEEVFQTLLPILPVVGWVCQDQECRPTNVIVNVNKRQSLQSQLDSLTITVAKLQQHLSGVEKKIEASVVSINDPGMEQFSEGTSHRLAADISQDNMLSEVTSRHHPVKPQPQPQNRSNLTQKKVIGTGNNSNNAKLIIKSGVEVVQKAVVHVNNLDKDCTPELLKDYLLSQEITVYSCYSVKSWMRDNEKAHVTAYRVCISAAQHHNIMDPKIWSKGVVLRDLAVQEKGHSSNSAWHRMTPYPLCPSIM